MRSFISVSKKPNATCAIAALLTALMLYCCALEVITREKFTRTSKVQRRIMESRETAKKLHTTTTNGARTVLLVGNSLVVHGIDPNKLQEEIAPRYYCSVFAVENT